MARLVRVTTVRLALAAFLLLVLASPALPGAVGPARDTSTILVRFAQPAPGRQAVEASGDRIAGELKTGALIVKLAAGKNVDEEVARYAAKPGVVYAEPNYTASAYLASPNDPGYASQWAFPKISAPAGWSVYPGAYGVSGGAKLAVVDTGVDSTHPDLAGQMDTADGADCTSGTCVASTALDDNGHGTHVAGIAAAATNNSVGVAGTAFSSSVIPVKVLGSSGSGSYAAVAAGIIWAADHGARAMNLSLGGSSASSTLCNAVSYALSHGSLVVAAAGNSGTSAASYPAACPGAIGVAATDSTDATPSWSNFGSPDVFVSAPGVSIYSTYMGGGYATLSGTSMATPFVTGLSALLFGQSPSRTPAAVKAILASTSDKVGSGSYGSDPYGTCGGCTWNAKYGYGRIDVLTALSGTAPVPSPDFTLSVQPSSARVRRDKAVSFTVSIGAQGGFAGTVSLSVSGLPAGAAGTFAPTSVSGSGSSTLRVATSSSAPRGTYPLTVTGTSGALSHTAVVTLTVN